MTLVLAAADLYRHLLADRAQPDFSGLTGLLGGGDVNMNAAIGHRGLNCHQAALRIAGTGALDRAIDRALVAAQHMRDAVDHDLRSVDRAIAACAGIGALTFGMARKRERVLPAEIIPVIDRRGSSCSTDGSFASSASSLSAAGQDEHPWLVNNSTTTRCSARASGAGSKTTSARERNKKASIESIKTHAQSRFLGWSSGHGHPPTRRLR